MVNEFGFVVGGDAALQVASEASFVGSVCLSLADPAIVMADGDRDGWVPGRGPSGTTLRGETCLIIAEEMICEAYQHAMESVRSRQSVRCSKPARRPT